MGERLVVAYSWRLVSELARRHPSLVVAELHGGGGQYDELALVSAGGEPVVRVNRTGSVHVPDTGFAPAPLDEALLREDPAALARRIEAAAGLPSPRRAPATGPRALVYRLASHLVTSTVFGPAPFDVRGEYCDTSGGESGPRGLLAPFPIAAERAGRRRPGAHDGDASRGLWAVMRGGVVVAALDVDGVGYVGTATVDLPAAYAANGRSVGRLAAAVLPALVA